MRDYLYKIKTFTFIYSVCDGHYTYCNVLREREYGENSLHSFAKMCGNRSSSTSVLLERW